MRALAAGCLLLGVAFAVDVPALFVDGSSTFPNFNSYVLTGAANVIAVLSLVFFARAVRRRKTLSILAAKLDFRGSGSGHPWESLAYLAVLAALGWGIGTHPIGSRVSRLGAALAGVACIGWLVVAAAYSLGGFSQDFAWSLATLLAFCAAALSLGAQRP